MGGSDAGDDEDDPAMAAVTAEKMESDEDSDRGSDHSGLKRKSLAMKVSGGLGEQGQEEAGTWVVGPPPSCPPSSKRNEAS